MKSPFWSYFHDKLNWLPIFRPGPVSAIMRGLALHMDEVRQDILWLRKQWNPATCELELLERYGASRGTARTRFDTDDTYRQRVVHAYAWHKLGGKARGLERILAESGFTARVGNAEDRDLWAHFRVSLELGDRIYGEAEASFFWFLVNEYKPARSVIEYLRTVTTRKLPVEIGTGAINHTVTQAFTWRWEQALEQAPVYPATGMVDKTVTQTRPLNRYPEPGKLTGHAMAGARSFTISSAVSAAN